MFKFLSNMIKKYNSNRYRYSLNKYILSYINTISKIDTKTDLDIYYVTRLNQYLFRLYSDVQKLELTKDEHDKLIYNVINYELGKLGYYHFLQKDYTSLDTVKLEYYMYKLTNRYESCVKELMYVYRDRHHFETENRIFGSLREELVLAVIWLSFINNLDSKANVSIVHLKDIGRYGIRYNNEVYYHHGNDIKHEHYSKVNISKSDNIDTNTINRLICNDIYRMYIYCYVISNSNLLLTNKDILIKTVLIAYNMYTEDLVDKYGLRDDGTPKLKDDPYDISPVFLKLTKQYDLNKKLLRSKK